MRIEDPQKIVDDGEKLVQESEKYLDCINKIYQATEELTSNSWKGEKADQYISKIEEYHQPLIELGNVLNATGQRLVYAGRALIKFNNE